MFDTLAGPSLPCSCPSAPVSHHRMDHALVQAEMGPRGTAAWPGQCPTRANGGRGGRVNPCDRC